MFRHPGDWIQGAVALGAVLLVTLFTARWTSALNATTVVLAYLLVVLLVAATSRLRVALATSVASVLAFNFFFLPPVGTFSIADPQNWVALAAFLAVSVVASRLSATARTRAREALVRQRELARLFDLTRDVLVMTGSRESLLELAKSVARRFDLQYVAIGLPTHEWKLAEAGPLALRLDPRELAAAYGEMDSRLEFDARTRTYSGHRTLAVNGHVVLLVPLRLGVKSIGLLAAVGGSIDVGTLDALGAVVAIAIERAQLLEERASAEVARRGEELKTALLASLGHDLRTPLTAIRVAASNLQTLAGASGDVHEQSGLILSQAEGLSRVFENILAMARIDAGAIESDLRWTHPSEIVTAARAEVEHALAAHTIEVRILRDVPVHLDPRLTATALAHVLENAARYAPAGTAIEVTADVTAEGLVVRVRDHGPGIADADLPRLFDRFYRGASTKTRVHGTGMGLSIARGLLAVQHGRIWASNQPEGGAEFTIAVPAATRPAEAEMKAGTLA